MADSTAAEAEKRYIEKMGEALGEQFYASGKKSSGCTWNWAE
jgi:hypothetical protein